MASLSDATFNPFSQQNELDRISNEIRDTSKNLSAFSNPNSYLNLLGKVADASYLSNADTIAFRQAARQQLYGEQGYKPENYFQLSPEQQQNIRTSSRAGLTAAIQASQETEAARGNRTENLLATEGARYKDTRDTLSASLDRLTTRQTQLENAKQQAQSENRQIFFDLVKNYPDLVENLTPQEQGQFFNGAPDKKLMSKISLYAQQEAKKGRVQVVEKDGYIVGYDPVTGQQLYKIDTGIRDQRSGGGVTGSTTSKLLAEASSSGYTVEKSTDGGIVFKKDGTDIDKVAWENGVRNAGIGLGYLDVFEEIGTTKQQDIDELKASGRLVETRATGVDDEEIIRQGIRDAAAQGATKSEIVSYIKAQGFDPSKFGY